MKKPDNTLILAVYSLLLVLTLSLYSLQAKSATTKHEFHHPEQALKAIAGKKNAGELIYQAYCANCHAEKPLIQMGAPRIGSVDDWQPRLKKGLDKVFNKTNLGFNNMPAHGGCFECSDELLRAAIQYMLPKKKPNTLTEKE